MNDYEENYLEPYMNTVSGVILKIMELEQEKRQIMSKPPTEMARKQVDDINYKLIELKLESLDI